MSFLFPLYLLGFAAIAAPIFLHLRKKPSREHTDFSSHIFLEQTPEKTVRRARIERWFLLLLRCLAVLLLALAFGRPFFDSFSISLLGETEARAFILVDESASMRRDDLWDRAIAEAREAVERFDPEDDVSVAFFGSALEIAPGSEDLSSFLDLKEKSGPGWAATDLGAAMTQAADQLLVEEGEARISRREIVVISDFQSGAALDELKRSGWPEEVVVRTIALEPEARGNLSMSLAAMPPRSEIETEETYRVRVRNAEDSDFTAVTLGWDGFPDSRIETQIASGTSRILTTSPRPAGAEEGTLVVSGDAYDFDNRIYVAPVQSRPLRILFLDESGIEEAPGTPLFYLQRALQTTATLRPILRAVETVTEQELENSEVVVLSGTWSEETGLLVKDFVRNGGLVITLPQAGLADESLKALVDSAWLISESKSADYALLADLDFTHPILEPFARAQIRDFSRIRFWKQLALEMPETDTAKILATFDGKSPAWVEKELGNGSVFLFLSGWEPEQSQFALSSKFVPLLYSILENSGYSTQAAPSVYVDDTEFPAPGFYAETIAGEERLLAVNLSPSEGRTEPFDPVVLFTDLGIPAVNGAEPVVMDPLSPEEQVRMESKQREESQKLWRWLILSALLLLLVETWMAGRSSSRQTNAASPV